MSDTITIDVVDFSGKKTSDIALPGGMIARGANPQLVHQVVVSFLGNARGGTRAQKTRSQVRASTAKRWRQKGTGRARSGTRASPIWRGGGRAFPASPIDNFQRKVNKKMYRAAMRCVLTQLIDEGRVTIVEEIAMAEIKAKQALSHLRSIGAVREDNRRPDKVLIVADEVDYNFALSVRNLYWINFVHVSSCSIVDLLDAERIVLSKGAMERLSAKLA